MKKQPPPMASVEMQDSFESWVEMLIRVRHITGNEENDTIVAAILVLDSSIGLLRRQLGEQHKEKR